MTHPIWEIMRREGRTMRGLARRIGYHYGHLYEVKAERRIASATFRQRCAEKLGRPESELFEPFPPVAVGPGRPKPSPLGKDELTLPATAKALGVTRQRVHQMVNRGTLPAKPWGRRRCRVRQQDVERRLEERREVTE